MDKHYSPQSVGSKRVQAMKKRAARSSDGRNCVKKLLKREISGTANWDFKKRRMEEKFRNFNLQVTIFCFLFVLFFIIFYLCYVYFIFLFFPSQIPGRCGFFPHRFAKSGYKFYKICLFQNSDTADSCRISNFLLSIATTVQHSLHYSPRHIPKLIDSHIFPTPKLSLKTYRLFYLPYFKTRRLYHLPN